VYIFTIGIEDMVPEAGLEPAHPQRRRILKINRKAYPFDLFEEV